MSNRSFEVMTANVAGQERFGFNQRKKAAHYIFAQQKCDLVGFQELGLSNWDEVFAKARPDLNIVHGKAAGDIIINSLAYRPERFELILSDTVWLTPDGRYGRAWGGAERGMTWAEFLDKESERRFLFVNAHFDNASKLARINSIDLILKWKWPFGKLPIIFTADANISVASPHEHWSHQDMQMPYDMMINAGFKDAWKETHHGEKRPFTYHNFRGTDYNVMVHDKFGTYDTDWIMTKGFIVEECDLVTDSFEGVYPSDHFFMRARLCLCEEKR